jgi:hypothetical protein
MTPIPCQKKRQSDFIKRRRGRHGTPGRSRTHTHTGVSVRARKVTVPDRSHTVAAVTSGAGAAAAFSHASGNVTTMIFPAFAAVAVLALVWSPGPAGAATVAERAALVDLYNATSGTDWHQNSAWLSGDPCSASWYGVSCSQPTTEGNVEYVTAMGRAQSILFNDDLCARFDSRLHGNPWLREVLADW